MAAPNLPSLARDLSSVISVPSMTGVLALTNLITLFDADPYWIVEASDLVGAVPYVEVRPRLTSDAPAAAATPPLPDQRIIFAVSVSAGAMGYYQTGPGTSRISTGNANHVSVLYAPEGGSASKDAGFPDVAEPYTGVFNLGYYGLFGSPNGANNWDLWIISSNEEVSVFAQDQSVGATANAINMGFIGANLVPMSDDPNDADTDDRLYGMTLQATYNNNSFWTNSSSLFNWVNNSNSYATYRCVYRDPASGNRVGCNAFKLDQAPNNARMKGGSGALAAFDVRISAQYGVAWTIPNEKFLGWMRQIRPFGDVTDKFEVESGGQNVGYAVGMTRGNDSDAIFLDNVASP